MVVIFKLFAANKKLGQKSLEVKNIFLGFIKDKALYEVIIKSNGR